jgi:hypothetical protein
MIPCRKCGHENPDGTRFCESCKAYVGWGRGQPGTRAAVTRPPPPPAQDATEDATQDTSPQDDEQDPVASDRWKVRVIELGRASRRPPSPAATPQAVPPQPPAADEVEAVKPGEQRPPPPRRTPERHSPPSSARPPPPGAVQCGNCGRYNEPTTRFCRCGAQLTAPAKPVPTAAGPPPPSPLPWYRRIFGGSPRQASSTARAGYDRALSLRARWVRVALVLGMLGIGVMAIAPWGAGARDWVAGQIAEIRGYESVAVSETAVDPPSARRAGFLAVYATDGQPTRAWAVGWRGADTPAPEGACGQVDSRASGVLLVSFAQESSVDRVTVQAGLARENQEWSKQSRPRTIELRFSNGDCHRLLLEDRPEPQTFDVSAGAVTGVTVAVLDAYRHLEGSGRLVAISEIAFARRP